MSKKRNDAHARKLRSVAKRRKREEQSTPYHVRTRLSRERYAAQAAEDAQRLRRRQEQEAAYLASLSSDEKIARDARLLALKEQIECEERKLVSLTKHNDFEFPTLYTVEDTRTSAHEPKDALTVALNKAFKAVEDERRLAILGPGADAGLMPAARIPLPVIDSSVAAFLPFT